MNNKVKLAVSIIIALALGCISTWITRDSMEIYTNLELPIFSPPSTVFPIVWTILYILMGISSFMIYVSNSRMKNTALLIYIVQLLFNSIWTITFFNLENYGFAIFVLIALILMVIIMMLYFYKIDIKSCYLQIPYLLWLMFALYLNVGIWLLN